MTTEETAIEVTKQFQENADLAYKALTFYEFFKETDNPDENLDPCHSTETQLIRFLQAWYRIRTFRVDFLTDSISASSDYPDLKLMQETMCWLLYTCDEKTWSELRIVFAYASS